MSTQKCSLDLKHAKNLSKNMARRGYPSVSTVTRFSEVPVYLLNPLQVRRFTAVGAWHYASVLWSQPCTWCSYSSHEQQHHDDDHHQPKPTAGSIAPASAVRPARNCADQQQNQHNQQDRSQAHDASFLIGSCCKTACSMCLRGCGRRVSILTEGRG